MQTIDNEISQIVADEMFALHKVCVCVYIFLPIRNINEYTPF